jgi:cell fate regulator YaaT (PSP1 superfamily)
MKVTAIYCFAQKETVELPFVNNDDYKNGNMVIFANKEGKEEAGKILIIERKTVDEPKVLADSSVLRKMAARDIQIMETNVDRGKGVIASAMELVEKHGLDMQLFDAAYSFDGSRINFIFTADDRVDFRELVKDLAKKFQKQIHLKQIGPRDKAKIVSGIGRCGRGLCCSSFLNRLESISMDMVRDQDLMSKGSSKLSGTCGKLLCCLRYEVESYKDLKSNLPPMGSKIKTKALEGYVVGLDILNQKVKVRVDERDYQTCDGKDVLHVTPGEERPHRPPPPPVKPAEPKTETVTPKE